MTWPLAQFDDTVTRVCGCVRVVGPGRFRHLVTDLQLLLPHSKKDAKLENTKENRAVLLNEAAELKNCSSCLFFEGRKKQDLYMWMSKTPNGPSAKFLVSAVHTMAELKLTGNHLKGSRPIVTFSPGFDQHPHLQLLKEMFIQVFSTPHQHRKSKPFFDHVMAFSLLDKHVWVRNYQVGVHARFCIVVPHHGTAKLEKGALDKTTLVEGEGAEVATPWASVRPPSTASGCLIGPLVCNLMLTPLGSLFCVMCQVGPRFCLNPIKVFAGSFGGATLFENPFYVSPNTVRANIKRAKAGKYASKVKAKQRRKQHQGAFPAEADEFADLWKQGDDAGDDIDE
eukprot:jgi/Mesen1/6311/ME000325S05449